MQIGHGIGVQQLINNEEFLFFKQMYFNPELDNLAEFVQIYLLYTIKDSDEEELSMSDLCNFMD